MEETLLKLSGNLLNITGLAYLAATVLYLVYLAKRSDGLGLSATIISSIGVVLHTAALVMRWVSAGIDHPPFTNLYESLIFFGWGIVAFYLYMEWRYKIRLAGAFVFPIALAAMGIAAMTPDKGIGNLMPALQSNWLTFHVMFASIAYAAFVVAFAFSFMYLIKDKVQIRAMGIILSGITAATLAICDKASIITKGKFYMNVMGYGSDGKLYMAPVPDMQDQLQVVPVHMVGIFFLLAFILLTVSFVTYLASYIGSKPSLAETANLAMLAGLAVLTIGMIDIFIGISLNDRLYFASNPYKLILLGLEWLSLVAVAIINWKRESIIERLPERKTLDFLGYRSIIVAFPLMTIVIVTGAVWANSAWGTYWQWDPKETWSLITWFIYAIYLHARVMAGWSGRRVAIISIIGFVSVVFTYLGVNVFLSGLHSYA